MVATISVVKYSINLSICEYYKLYFNLERLKQGHFLKLSHSGTYEGPLWYIYVRFSHWPHFLIFCMFLK